MLFKQNNINTTDAKIWLDRYLRDYEGLHDSLSMNNYPDLQLMMLETMLPDKIIAEYKRISNNPYDIIVGNLKRTEGYHSAYHTHFLFVGCQGNRELGERYRVLARKPNSNFYDKNIYMDNQTEMLKHIGINTAWRTDADKYHLIKQVKKNRFTIVNYREKRTQAIKALFIKELRGNYIHFIDPEFEHYYNYILNPILKDEVDRTDAMTVDNFIKKWMGGYRVNL